jgi:hypothetical protein
MEAQIKVLIPIDMVGYWRYSDGADRVEAASPAETMILPGRPRTGK